MGITLIIVGGVVTISVIASVFDYLGKKKKGAGSEIRAKVLELEKKVELLEANVHEKAGKIEQLETDLGFMNKLLEKKD